MSRKRKIAEPDGRGPELAAIRRRLDDIESDLDQKASFNELSLLSRQVEELRTEIAANLGGYQTLYRAVCVLAGSRGKARKALGIPRDEFDVFWDQLMGPETMT